MESNNQLQTLEYAKELWQLTGDQTYSNIIQDLDTDIEPNSKISVSIFPGENTEDQIQQTSEQPNIITIPDDDELENITE